MDYFKIRCVKPSLLDDCIKQNIYKLSPVPMYNATSLQSVPLDENTGIISNGDVLIFDSSTNQWTYGSVTPSIDSYGEMYALTGQNVSITGGGVFVGMTGMSSTELKNITFSEAPPSTLTVDNTGVYNITLGIDGSSTANNVNISSQIYINGIPQTRFSVSRHYQQAGDDGSVSCSGLISLTSGDDVTLHFSSDVSTTFTTHNVSITILQIG